MDERKKTQQQKQQQFRKSQLNFRKSLSEQMIMSKILTQKKRTSKFKENRDCWSRQIK